MSHDSDSSPTPTPSDWDAWEAAVADGTAPGATEEMKPDPDGCILTISTIEGWTLPIPGDVSSVLRALPLLFPDGDLFLNITSHSGTSRVRRLVRDWCRTPKLVALNVDAEGEEIRLPVTPGNMSRLADFARHRLTPNDIDTMPWVERVLAPQEYEILFDCGEYKGRISISPEVPEERVQAFAEAIGTPYTAPERSEPIRERIQAQWRLEGATDPVAMFRALPDLLGPGHIVSISFAQSSPMLSALCALERAVHVPAEEPDLAGHVDLPLTRGNAARLADLAATPEGREACRTVVCLVWNGELSPVAAFGAIGMRIYADLPESRVRDFAKRVGMACARNENEA